MVVGECMGVLAGVEVEVLVDLLVGVVLEEKVHVYSSSVKMLSQMIMTMMFAIRPLKYPFPVIFNLPANKYCMLESPLPAIIGLTIPE